MKFQSALDSTVVHGWNYYWKSTYLPELRDDLIDAIAEHTFSCSSPRSYVAMFHLKGAVSRVAQGATAFGNRQAWHAVTLDAVWRPGEDFGDRDTAWTRELFSALGRFRDGVYINFLGGDEGPDRVREAYGDSVYDRLAEVKTTYDPENVFHHNQNSNRPLDIITRYPDLLAATTSADMAGRCPLPEDGRGKPDRGRSDGRASVEIGGALTTPPRPVPSRARGPSSHAARRTRAARAPRAGGPRP